MKRVYTIGLSTSLAVLSACSTQPVDMQSKKDTCQQKWLTGEIATKNPRLVLEWLEKQFKDPLIAAVEKNDLEEVKKLVAAGADVNQPRLIKHFSHDTSPYTLAVIGAKKVYSYAEGTIDAPCLLIAALNNNMPMVAWLVEHYADKNALVTVKSKKTKIISQGCYCCHPVVEKWNTQYTMPIWRVTKSLVYGEGFKINPKIIAFIGDCKSEA